MGEACGGKEPARQATADIAEIFIPFWPLAPVVTTQAAIKIVVNNGFVVGLPGGIKVGH